MKATQERYDQARVMIEGQAKQFLNRLGGLVRAGTPAALKIATLYEIAATYKLDALMCPEGHDAEKAALLDQAETAIMRAETVAKAEGVVASDEFARWLSGAAKATLSAIVDVAHGFIVTGVGIATAGLTNAVQKNV